MNASKPGPSGAKRRVIRFERKRQALLGNQRAVTHGRTTAAAKAARLEALKEHQSAEKARSDTWARTVPQTDYGAIVDQLRALRRAKR
ncbi:hypothetical protein P0R31_10880 [Bradyrhizobium yuanmingense]|uniref:hypothetical protein n=1 Tax=Bradyrhizobium yuanmingense TaxID=108015 RepID=UPI0023BA1986|nr:hypothetical protein [Bradyrhizobium yuanmingense]MDF0517736.1 hypothetical protein [Bradyrhizobium yuanmingense]